MMVTIMSRGFSWLSFLGVFADPVVHVYRERSDVLKRLTRRWNFRLNAFGISSCAVWNKTFYSLISAVVPQLAAATKMGQVLSKFLPWPRVEHSRIYPVQIASQQVLAT